MARLTPAQAKELANRWARVNQAEIDELNATPPEILLRQLDSPLGRRYLPSLPDL